MLNIDTLITINTFNRQALTAKTIDSVLRFKGDNADVLIIDDMSTDYDARWLCQWGLPVIRVQTKMGVGMAFRYAFERFLRTGLSWVCSLPSDVIVAKEFHNRTRAGLIACGRPDCDCACGYRSTFHAITPITDEFGTASVTGGVGLMAHRTAVTRAMEKSKPVWDTLYDFEWSKLFDKIITPTRSLIEHTGAMDSGKDTLHKGSADKAVDFVGEGQ